MSAPAPTASPLVRRYTLEEFRELERPPGGGRYESIAGVLCMVPPPTSPHDMVEQRALEHGQWRVVGPLTGTTPCVSAVFPGLRAVPAEAFTW